MGRGEVGGSWTPDLVDGGAPRQGASSIDLREFTTLPLDVSK